MKNDIVTRYRNGGLPDPKIEWPTMHFESGGGAAASDGSGNGGTTGSDTGADGTPGNSDSGPADTGTTTGVTSDSENVDTDDDGQMSMTITASPDPGPAPAPSGPSDAQLGLVSGETAGVPKGGLGNMIGSTVASMLMKAALTAVGIPAPIAAVIASVVAKGGLGSGTATTSTTEGGGCGGSGLCSSTLSTLAGLSGSGSKSGLGTGASPDGSDQFLDSKAEMLVSKAVKEKDPAAINELIQMFGDRAGSDVASVEALSPLSYADGGSTSNAYTEDMNALKLVPDTPDFISPLSSAAKSKKQSMLQQLKHIQPKISNMGNMDGMAQGGLPKKYQDAAPEGHNTEFVTGLTGFYACGRGTGQSDCIPAMLHDGDYVMDAEAVSALGDGSSKAGKEVLEKFHKQIPHHAASGGKVVPARIADGEYVFPAGFVTALGGGDNKRGSEILDGLREKLRNHKRSAPTSKIPPKAKSPLDYLKMAKG